VLVDVSVAPGALKGWEVQLKIEISRVPVEEILSLRDLYRQEMNCQIVHDSYHARGFTDSYLIRGDGRLRDTVVWRQPERSGRDVIKEFYVLPYAPSRRASDVPTAHRGQPGPERSRPRQTMSFSP